VDRLVLTVHDSIFLRHPEWFKGNRATYYRHFGRRSARKAAHIIADSNHTAQDVQTLMYVDSSRITTIPLGVDATFTPQPKDAVESVRKRYQLPARFFLYVGTLEPRKNLDRVVRAWDSIASDVPQDLVIAGRVGWKTQALENAIAATQHKHRIHRPGFIAGDDLPALLSAAQAFVWPSLYEGFGLPVLEAMACGTPVITSTTSSLPEVTGDAALLVDPGDETAIAKAMRQLSNDDALQDTLAARGPERATRFTWEQCAAQTMAIYRQVAGR
jgi:glycosyltransferase involved in cell wall biosynthesis